MKRPLLALVVGLLTTTTIVAATATASTVTGGLTCSISAVNAENMSQSISSGSSVPVGTNVWLGVKASGQVTTYEWWLDDGHQGNVRQPVSQDHWDYRLWTNRTFTFTVKVSGPSGSALCRFVVRGGDGGPAVTPSCTMHAMDANNMAVTIHSGQSVPVGTNVWMGVHASGQVNSYKWYVDDGVQGNVLQPFDKPEWDYTVWTNRKFTFTVKVSGPGGNGSCSFMVVGGDGKGSVKPTPKPKPSVGCPAGFVKNHKLSTKDKTVCTKTIIVKDKPSSKAKCPKGTKLNKKASKPGVLVCERTRIVSAGKPAHTK